MRKIYEANIKEIIKQIEIDNDSNAFDIQIHSSDLIGIKDITYMDEL